MSAIKWATERYVSDEWDENHPWTSYHNSLALAVIGTAFENGKIDLAVQGYRNVCDETIKQVSKNRKDRNEWEKDGSYSHEIQGNFSDLIKNGAAAVNRAVRDGKNSV